MNGSQKVFLPTLMTLMYRYLLSIALCKRLCIGSYKKCCPANMNELQKILEKLFLQGQERFYILSLNYLSTLSLKLLEKSFYFILEICLKLDGQVFYLKKARTHIRNQLLSCSKHHTICKQISFCTMAAFGYFCPKII